MFIPLLLMGGIIGRLFREFAVTLTMAIAVSAFVSLTLTPMMASRFLQAAKRDTGTAGSIEFSERGFDALLAATSAGSISCCATSSSRCASSSRRWRSPVCLFVIIPKGFFPQQDTGLITGIRKPRRTSRLPR